MINVIFWLVVKIMTANATGFKLKNTACKKFLRIKVDCRLKFETYLDGAIKKASNLINALPRVNHL